MAPPLRFAVRSVAIIGAGPCGLAAAKYIRDQGTFQRIVVYEQNAEVGGAWNYSHDPPPADHIPSVSPWIVPDEPLPPNKDAGETAPMYPTAIYELLYTNVPHPLMGFSDLTFASVFDKDGGDPNAETPEGGVLTIYPQRQDVFRYVVRYAQDLRSLLRLSTVVEDVHLVERRTTADTAPDSWEVRSRSTVSGKASVETFDAVIVANGHYDVTYLPDVPGIRAFSAAHPGVVMHAKKYRSADAFAGKKVLVVGNAASGLDIGLQVNAVCRRPLLLSVHAPTAPDMLGRIVDVDEVPAIAEYLVEERGVRLTDGRVVRDLDAIIYCTGYLFALPFLERNGRTRTVHVSEQDSKDAGAGLGGLDRLLFDGHRVHGLYRELFHIDHPTLAFVGLPYKVIPFPVSEAQAALVARVWANALPLPSREAMRQSEQETENERPSRAFHVWPQGGDGRFINDTYRLIMEESGEAARAGKVPPRWSAKQLWMRQIHLEGKGRFEDAGRTATTLEELGYVYEGDGEEIKLKL